eukprot:4594235-Pyramimonas_sp.AAC.1
MVVKQYWKFVPRLFLKPLCSNVPPVERHARLQVIPGSHDLPPWNDAHVRAMPKSWPSAPRQEPEGAGREGRAFP